MCVRVCVCECECVCMCVYALAMYVVGEIDFHFWHVCAILLAIFSRSLGNQIRDGTKLMFFTTRNEVGVL